MAKTLDPIESLYSGARVCCFAYIFDGVQGEDFTDDTTRWSYKKFGLSWDTQILVGTVVKRCKTNEGSEWKVKFDFDGTTEVVLRHQLTLIDEEDSEHTSSELESDSDEDPDGDIQQVEIPVTDSENEDEIELVDEQVELPTPTDPTCTLQWTIPDEQVLDKRTGPRRKPTIPLALNKRKSVLCLFEHFMPMEYLFTAVIPLTNEVGRARYKNWVDLTPGELLRWLGMWIYMAGTFEPGSRSNYWTSAAENPSHIFPVHDFARFMTEHRFENIRACFTVTDITQYPEDDPLKDTRGFMEALQSRCRCSIEPGDELCEDEAIFASYHCNLPCQIYIKRKPHPLGQEIKTLHDCVTNILINFEMNEGKLRMASKPYRQLGAGTGTTLRLLTPRANPTHRNPRTIVGDSWFGSVTGTREVYKIGFYALFNVKTATRDFPLNMLDLLCEEGRGVWSEAVCSVDGVDLVAVLWRNKNYSMKVITSCSSTQPGQPRKSRNGNDVPQPKAVEEYFENYNMADIFNKTRMLNGSVDEALGTKRHQLRTFGGLLGFVVANVHFAYRYFGKSTNTSMDTRRELAEALICNPHLPALEYPLPPAAPAPHALHGHQRARKERKGRCVLCFRNKGERHQTHTYCIKCNVFLCNDQTRACFENHIT
eukprot:comp24200_c0_seq1/m.44440 comp24200_c0_seq1/g.44440  ORF comp24200_c0_seq1/g.44440 comp24200_c0_seq1/m.44440 type:complete len:652 (-) comp24200_c0_seq1:589-2544(-)